MRCRCRRRKRRLSGIGGSERVRARILPAVSVPIPHSSVSPAARFGDGNLDVVGGLGDPPIQTAAPRR